jgi:hypothetical protein
MSHLLSLKVVILKARLMRKRLVKVQMATTMSPISLERQWQQLQLMDQRKYLRRKLAARLHLRGPLPKSAT